MAAAHGSNVSQNVIDTIIRTTREAYGTPHGTIVAKKKGDGIWWMLSVALGVTFLVFISNPRYFTQLAMNIMAQ